MRRLAGIVLLLLPGSIAAAAGVSRDEAAVREPVEAFYAAFDAGFVGPANFAAEDWTHINPFGGWTRGRENVLKEVRDVHRTFLKDVTESVRETEVRLVGADAAVVTVVSTMSRYVTPDGAAHENERHIRTFVVAKRAGRWLVVQDQNTTILPIP